MKEKTQLTFFIVLFSLGLILLIQGQPILAFFSAFASGISLTIFIAANTLEKVIERLEAKLAKITVGE